MVLEIVDGLPLLSDTLEKLFSVPAVEASLSECSAAVLSSGSQLEFVAPVDVG